MIRSLLMVLTLYNNVLKGDIHSLYHEALYAHVNDKLSYDIIGLVALIDRVKRAANRYLRNEEQIASTKLISNIISFFLIHLFFKKSL